MANTILHKAETRGHANHGWLNSYHTFSFGSYYNPQRMNFGALRVLNDDTVDAGKGFGTHPHDNMEIISIPLEGDLENKDRDQRVKFLQIWVYPDKKNVEPRYDQITLNLDDRHNKLQQILSPNAN